MLVKKRCGQWARQLELVALLRFHLTALLFILIIAQPFNKNFGEKFGRNYQPWRDQHFITHHDNASLPTAFVVKDFMKHVMPVLDHTPYSHDLTPCNFLLHNRLKEHMREDNLAPQWRLQQNCCKVSMLFHSYIDWEWSKSEHGSIHSFQVFRSTPTPALKLCSRSQILVAGSLSRKLPSLNLRFYALLVKCIIGDVSYVTCNSWLSCW